MLLHQLLNYFQIYFSLAAKINLAMHAFCSNLCKYFALSAASYASYLLDSLRLDNLEHLIGEALLIDLFSAISSIFIEKLLDFYHISFVIKLF